jgi:hypothetical protein
MVSYFVTSALGRELTLGDWQTLQSDTILKSLCSFETSPFNPDHQASDLVALCSVTGLGPADVQMLCESLGRDGLVEAVRGQAAQPGYRITAKGIAFVRSAPGRALLVGNLR